MEALWMAFYWTGPIGIGFFFMGLGAQVFGRRDVGVFAASGADTARLGRAPPPARRSCACRRILAAKGLCDA